MPRSPASAPPPRLAACDLFRPELADDGRAAVAAWAAHVAAGQIGRSSPASPEARARLARSEAVLCVRRPGLW